MWSVSLLLLLTVDCFFFFFKQKTAYELRISDWSSDVCSSDLTARSGVTRSRRWRPEMAEIADKELEALQDGFDTLSLIHAVDELDKMRGHLKDRKSVV